MLITVVSSRIDFNKTSGEFRDAIDQRLLSWILNVGAFPVPMPNVMNTDDAYSWLKKLAPAAIVLSGGNDIGENNSRDNTERILIHYALDMGLPLFGICRGLQMIATFFGEQLKSINHHVGIRHYVYGEISGEVNSFHKFSIRGCPKQFKILSRSADGEIEALRDDKLKWECWMWHPEREKEWNYEQIARARKILSGDSM